MAKTEENIEQVDIEGIKKTVTPPLTDGQLDKIATSMKDILDAMPKVRVRIPKDKQNKEDLVVPVCINGYIYQINRGETVEVPEEVAFQLDQAGYLG